MIRKSIRDNYTGGSTPSSGVNRPSANRTGVTENGVTYSATGSASEDPNAYYSEILARFSDGSMSLEELYNYLSTGLSGNNMTTEQREDFLKQMIDSMLAKRQLDEQRSYDNPLTQLNRLMATGMSRDAALQAIQGGAGSGSSGGSPLIGAAGSPAPSESYANEVQAKTSIANTALNALQCAASVASFGISIPGQIANNTIAQVSAKATTQAQTALESINAGVSALDACVDAGIISRDDADAASRGSRTLDAALQHCAKIDPYSAAAQFLNSPQYQELTQNPFSAKVASDRYLDARRGDDVATSLAYEYQMRHGAEILQGIDIDKASAELVTLWDEHEDFLLDAMIKHYDLENIKPAELKLLFSQIGATEASRSLTEQEMKLFGLKKRQLKSSIRLNNSLSGLYTNQGEIAHQTALRLGKENELFGSSLEWTWKDPISGEKRTGAEWLTMGMLGEYANTAMTYYGLLHPKYRKAYMDGLVNDAKFHATDMTLKFLYQTDALRYYSGDNNMGDWYKFIHGTNFIFRNPVNGVPTGVGESFKYVPKITTPQLPIKH